MVDLHEYQGKELFRRYAIPVSEGSVAVTPEEARAAAAEIGGPVVVKAQVLTGGRGKAGGVKLAEDADDAEAKAREILGLDIRGHVVGKVLVEQASAIAKEYYLSVALDRSARKPLLMLTREGGVDIEEVAARDAGASRGFTSTRSWATSRSTAPAWSTRPGSTTRASGHRYSRSSRTSTAASSPRRRCSARSTR